MILTTIVPTRPYIGLYSIPRDLWVDIPDAGSNRINTVHFFAEAAKTGSGPAAVRRVVERDFGVKVPYYVRIRFDGVVRVVDALGGLTITLPEVQSGHEAGTHTWDGTKALAFIRDRKGSDDFFRMQRGQLAYKSTGLGLPGDQSPELAANSRHDFCRTECGGYKYPHLGLAAPGVCLCTGRHFWI